MIYDLECMRGCARLAVVAEIGAMPHTRTEESS